LFLRSLVDKTSSSDKTPVTEPTDTEITDSEEEEECEEDEEEEDEEGAVEFSPVAGVSETGSCRA